MIKSDAELERLLKAIANIRRVKALRFLSKKKEASVGEISQELKLSFNAISKHLSILQKAGLLTKDQRSILCFYSCSELGLVILEKLSEL